VLQYRWVGQVSDAERERRERNLRTAALQFREAFDGEIARAAMGLRPGATTVGESAWYRFADRYQTWADTATEPRIVAGLFLIDADGDKLRLRRWNTTLHQFDDAAWPAGLLEWRPQFEDALAAFKERRPLDRRIGQPGDDAFLVLPLPNVGPRPPAPDDARPDPVFAFTALQLDLRFIGEQWLPELAARHFSNAEGDSYRVAVLSATDPARVIYRSDAGAPTDPGAADAVEPLHSAFLGGRPLFIRRGPEDRRDGRRGAANGVEDNGTRGADVDDDRRVAIQVFRGPGGGPTAVDLTPRFGDRGEGRWTLLVQHMSGSLEAAVVAARRRNLGISFGILMLLSVTIALLAATSRRAERLGRQQMEFVAGVSHELRTPVAVIRSAAENLAHGVVGSGDKVKRYGEVIETEARRLGDMVERVLLYAGIESGLGMAARTPISPGAVIDGAIEAAASTLPGARIERVIAADLPPVMGDATALRSAVQNLIVNAVKYGRDNWVGVRAEVAGTGRRPDVRITVLDHGQGIPPEDLPHIFDPFYRGRDAVARQVHGNGLGLSLVKRIVVAHGGRVTVSTEPGAGSAFTIILPVAEPAERIVPGAEAAEPAQGAARP
jgi:signal transduction histidine kinase